ncbi:storkhead-box protein 1 [Caerostris darwini]|uniref:Storkhead-box protein 1 n=1 Tax=Caerostris darwini TaxID=1538125 RepID=A0AAV4R2U2_9ARAC|nr:storkhead-box protein 1 [Caerostris darwini]
MSPSQRLTPSKPDTNKVLLSKGLAIVLKRIGPLAPDEATKSGNNKKKNRRQRKEPVTDKPCKGCEEIAECEFGPEVFMDWTRENGECFWNPCLVQSVKSLEYKGFVRPTTLLVGGTDYSLEVVRSAWGRRMLRPPNGYDIVLLDATIEGHGLSITAKICQTVTTRMLMNNDAHIIVVSLEAIWLRRNGRPKQAAAAASEYPPTRPCPVMTGPGHDPLRYSVSAMTRAMVYDPIMRVSVVCLSYLDFIISPCQSECKNNMGVRNDLSCDWC